MRKLGVKMVLKYLKNMVKKEKVLPIHIIYEVTRLCNSRCKHCYNWRSLKGYDSKVELDIKEIEKISKSMNDILYFSLTGGEVLLRKDIADIIKIFYKNNKIETAVIPTNCLSPKLIRKRVTEILKVYPKRLFLVLSLDGIGKMHDEIRGIKGNFSRFLETYKLLDSIRGENKRLSIGVNTVINNINKDSYNEIYQYVKKKLKVQSHNFELMRGLPRDSKVSPPSIEWYEKNKKNLQRMICSYDYYENLKIFRKFIRAMKIYYHDVALEIMKKKKQVIPCYAGRLSAVITANGGVYPCELYKKIGNLRDYKYDFKKLWFSPQANKIREEIADKKCHCYHQCFQIVNILFNPSLITKYIRYYNK